MGARIAVHCPPVTVVSQIRAQSRSNSVAASFRAIRCRIMVCRQRPRGAQTSKFWSSVHHRFKILFRTHCATAVQARAALLTRQMRVQMRATSYRGVVLWRSCRRATARLPPRLAAIIGNTTGRFSQPVKAWYMRSVPTTTATAAGIRRRDRRGNHSAANPSM